MAYNYMREQAKKIKKQEKHNIYVNINNERQEKLTTLMLKKGVNSFDDFDSESLVAFCNEAMTAEHVAEISSLKKEMAQKNQQLDIIQNNIQNKELELKNRDETIEQYRKKLIQTHSEIFLTHIGIAKLFILLGKWWWLISTIILFIGSSVVTVLITRINKLTPTNILIGLGISILPIIINLSVTIINKLSSQNFVIKTIHEKCYKCATRCYKKHIIRKLPSALEPYQEDIVEYCLNHCNILNSLKD